MPRPLPLLGLALVLGGCAVHRAKADARRAWIDVSLDDPVQVERVLAFLDSYDPVIVGERTVTPPTVTRALAWLDTHRTESRRWIDEVVQANDRFDADDLPQETTDELSRQLVGVVLEMGPLRADQPLWPEGATPYPWPVDDGELRASLFGLYLQTGRLCVHASRPIPGCEVEGVNLAWAMAAELLREDGMLDAGIRRPAEREALSVQGWGP